MLLHVYGPYEDVFATDGKCTIRICIGMHTEGHPKNSDNFQRACGLEVVRNWLTREPGIHILILRLLCEHHYSYCSKLAFWSKVWLTIVLMEKKLIFIFRMNYSFIYCAMDITMWNGKHKKPSSTYLFTKHLYQPYPISIIRMMLCRKLQGFHAEDNTPTHIKKRFAYHVILVKPIGSKTCYPESVCILKSTCDGKHSEWIAVNKYDRIRNPVSSCWKMTHLCFTSYCHGSIVLK